LLIVGAGTSWIVVCMSLARLLLSPHAAQASVALCCAAGLLFLWTAAPASDTRQLASAPAVALVTVSLLDMSRLAPAEFGDWEPAVIPTSK